MSFKWGIPRPLVVICDFLFHCFWNNCFNGLFLFQQIHKQAPPLEDIAEDCSTSMRELLEAALERNPNHRLSAADLLKHEALHPPPEEQPRCQSLDSALFERKRLLARKELQLPENITGNDIRLTYLALCRFYFVSKLDLSECLETNKTQKASGKIPVKLPIR